MFQHCVGVGTNTNYCNTRNYTVRMLLNVSKFVLDTTTSCFPDQIDLDEKYFLIVQNIIKTSLKVHSEHNYYHSFKKIIESIMCIKYRALSE